MKIRLLSFEYKQIFFPALTQKNIRNIQCSKTVWARCVFQMLELPKNSINR